MRHNKLEVLTLSLAASVGIAYDVNVHISLGADSDMGISWQSPVDVKCDSLLYGIDKLNLKESATSRHDCTVYKGDTFHHVILSGLTYDREYFYSISCSPTIRSFRSGLPPGVSKSFSFGVYADLGPVHGEATLESLHRIKDSLVGHIFAGDIGYADDAFLRSEGYITRLNEFLRAIEPSSESIPVMVAPGNHEAEDHTPVCLLSPGCRHGLGNFTAYNCVWNMPSVDRRHSMWYSFNYGPVHFVMTNTETDFEGAPLEPYGEIGFISTGKFGQPGEYEEWLSNDIRQAASERHIRPWIIVVGHRPITVLDDRSDPFRTPLNQRIIDLIGTHADAYISGHVHYYARSTPKENSAFQAHVITVGGAGCDEWEERRIKDTRKGETDLFEYFGFGDEQTFGTLSFDKDIPDRLVFELKRSGDRTVVDRVVIPRRKPSDEAVYISTE